MANVNREAEEHEPEDRLARIQAELAAKEREALEAIKEDLCQWLATVLELEIGPLTFLDALDTGVPLCNLATLVQESARALGSSEEGRRAALRVPLDAITCNIKAESGTFFARDNTSNFISWCRRLGVEESVMFESDGLVLHRDEKRVILCLLDVARHAERVGISPPQLVRMEREIESLEAKSDVSEVSVEDSPSEAEEEGEGERGETDPPRAKRMKPGVAEDQRNTAVPETKVKGGKKRTTPEPQRRRKKLEKEESFDDKASACQTEVGIYFGVCLGMSRWFVWFLGHSTEK